MISSLVENLGDKYPNIILNKSGCSKLENPENGALMNPIGEKAVIMCNDGYVLVGTRFAYCDGKNWTNKLGKCIESSHKKDQSCDFESEDQCGWQGETFGNSWHRTKDHTSDGYFVSLFTMTFDKIYHYESPIFPRMLSLSTSCFRFRYKIEGNEKGLLVVSVKPSSLSLDHMQSGKYGNFSKMAISRSQNGWHVETIAIDKMDTDFQIVFTYSSNGVSSVGVDNVKLMTGQSCMADHLITTSEAPSAAESTSGHDYTTESTYYPNIPDTFELTTSTVSTDFKDNNSSESESKIKASNQSTYASELIGLDTTSPRMSCFNRCGQIMHPGMDHVALQGTYIKGCGCSEHCVDDNNCCEDFIIECLTKNIPETKEPIPMETPPKKEPTPTNRFWQSKPSTSSKMNCSNRCGQIMRPGMDHVASDGTYIKGCGCSVHCIQDDNCCDDYFKECESKENTEIKEPMEPMETGSTEISTPMSTNPISAQMTYIRAKLMIPEAEGQVNNIDIDVIEVNAGSADLAGLGLQLLEDP
nr:uncharacterized protein LOC108119907 [Drosophila bipectinata]